MAFDTEAWEKAVFGGTAPRWKYQSIQGIYHTFGEALISYEPFMDFKVRELCDKLMRDFTRFIPAWRTFVHTMGVAAACKWVEETREYDDDYGLELMYESEETLVNDRQAQARWMHRKVIDRLPHIRAEMRDEANVPGTELYGHRDNYPVEGVYSNGRNYVLPLTVVVGFCPKCHEPLTTESLDTEQHQTYLTCTACRTTDYITALEAEYGWPFHCIPFSDVPVADAA